MTEEDIENKAEEISQWCIDKREAFIQGYQQAIKDLQSPSLCDCTETHDQDEVERNKCDDCKRRIN